MGLDYYQVDVFSKKPFSGNGLIIFPNADTLTKASMKLLTQEMRQFESIFYYQKDVNTYRAYIFTMEEELDFAGHPLLGLASIIHELYAKDNLRNEVNIELNKKIVKVVTIKNEGYYSATMNQGTPKFLYSLNQNEEKEFLSYLNLNHNDKYQNTNFEVVTTGLPYLIVPVKSSSLSKVKVTIPDLAKHLLAVNAKFFYVLDVENRKGRTWDNAGLVEDIATGSSAGPVGAFLVKNGLEKLNTQIVLTQGEFVNRKSILKVFVNGKNSNIEDVLVEGDVVKIGTGTIIAQIDDSNLKI